MPHFDVNVLVRLREGTLDPAAEALEDGLSGLGFEGVRTLGIDRRIRLRIEAADARAALASADRMARELLANPVLEDYEISVAGGERA